MKVAISIPDDLFDKAESLSKKLGVSRSRLYATAIEELVAKRSARKVTERLNAVYSEQDSGLSSELGRMQRRTLKSETEPETW
ncbi:MAG: hypothetical protein H6509_07170 [Bryobacterales bacterium]|nr:hypothetical protein [Bryobacterales bacterium]